MRSIVLVTWILLAGQVDANPDELESIAIGETAILIDDHPSFARPDYDDSNWPRRSWNEVSERGVWWLRHAVELPAAYRNAEFPIGLYIHAAAASEVWWNGRLVGRSGEVGATPSTEQPGPVDSVIALPADARESGTHLLAIRFSSQHAGADIMTPVDGLYLAPYGPPTRFLQDRYRPSLILGGSLALATVILLVMWLRERRPETGWLLVACGAALSQLLFEVSRAFYQYPYDWHEARLYGIAATAAIGGIGLVGYFVTRFRLAHVLWWTLATAAASTVLLLSGLPVGMATIGIVGAWLTIGLVACALAAGSRQPRAWVALLALSGMFAALWFQPLSFTDRNYFLALVALLLLVFADAVQRNARIQRARDRAELRSDRLALELLKRQLRPHFLLNTLATIQEWLETDPETASEMIDAVAREFRMLDRMAHRKLVGLDEELALCRAHLEVMSLRQERRYRLRVQGGSSLAIPPATLHTLLENAITHSKGGPDTYRFDLDIRREGDRAGLTLTTPLDSEDSDDDITEGTGLAYVRARLAEAFGTDAAVIAGPSGDHWRTRIDLPYTPSTDDEDNMASPKRADAYPDR